MQNATATSTGTRPGRPSLAACLVITATLPKIGSEAGSD